MSGAGAGPAPAGWRPAAALRRADLKLYQRAARAHSPWLDRSMPALSHAANYSRLWLWLSLLLLSSGRPAWRRAALHGLLSLGLASAAANGLGKLATRRVRPPLDEIPPARRVRLEPVTTSFPSGHAASASAFAAGAALEAPELALPLGALAAAVAWSRVWTGAHYPGDVAAGGALGAAIALATGRWRGR